MRRTALLGLLSLTLLSGCRTQIQQGLDERQANEILSLLNERGLSAEKVREDGKRPSWSIRVSDTHVTEAVHLLAELGLPRERAEGFAEVFGKGSLVPSASEERALFLQALSGEIARTLESFDGVVSARVHLVLPAAARPGQAAMDAKASAMLRIRPGTRARLSEREDALRALIAGGAEGLRPEAVSVVLDEVALPEPSRAPALVHPAKRLRWLSVGLACAVSGLSLGLIFLTLKLRTMRCRLEAQGLGALSS